MNVTGANLAVDGDLGRIMAVCLDDADLMYNNKGDTVVGKYGYEERMASARFLGISYAEARNPNTFDEAMVREIGTAINDDGAEAIIMGSTTMALSARVTDAAGEKPIFMPGMVALRVMENLWSDGLLR